MFLDDSLHDSTEAVAVCSAYACFALQSRPSAALQTRAQLSSAQAQLAFPSQPSLPCLPCLPSLVPSTQLRPEGAQR